MKKIIATLFSSPAPVEASVKAENPNTGYYGGLINQGAYGK